MKNLKKGLIAFSPLALAANVHAVVPTEVSTELANMKTDALAVGALVLVAVIAVAALKFMRRAV